MKFQTSNGHEVQIDDADAEIVQRWTWRAEKRHNTFYAFASIEGKNVRMHRLIMGAKAGEQIDHEDLNGLNNCRANLRRCTNGQNRANTPKRRGVESRFKGVTWNRTSRAWSARIYGQDVRAYLGLYATEEDAALAYDRAAEAHYGEFARLNIPESKRVPIRITRKYRKPNTAVLLEPFLITSP